MLDILKSFFTKAYNLLPDSPFQTLFADVDFDFLHWLNWFVPFDILMLEYK